MEIIGNRRKKPFGTWQFGKLVYGQFPKLNFVTQNSKFCKFAQLFFDSVSLRGLRGNFNTKKSSLI